MSNGMDPEKRTAIHQDTINGITDPMPWPVEWWAEKGDLLWTACRARAEGVDDLGIAYEKGDIIVHRHVIDGDRTRRTGAFLVIPRRFRRPLGEMVRGIATWENGLEPDRTGTVRTPGMARLTVPGTGREVHEGWLDAIARNTAHEAPEPAGTGDMDADETLATSALETSWPQVANLQDRLAGHVLRGTYDPDAALRSARRVADTAAVRYERAHGDPACDAARDTRFTPEQRQSAARLLLSAILDDMRAKGVSPERGTPEGDERDAGRGRDTTPKPSRDGRRRGRSL